MTLRHKRKNVAGYEWTGTDLVPGQIGVNEADGTAHILKSGGGYATLAEGLGDEVLIHGLGTGVVEGGLLTLGSGAPDATFSVTDGFGYIVDSTTDPDVPTITTVTWSGESDITVTDIATQLITYISVNSAGTIVQQTARWTEAQRRTSIILGVIVHVDNTVVDAVNNEQQVSINYAAQLADIFEGIGFVNVEGNIFGPNADNLNINKTVGIIMRGGINWDVDDQNPNHRTLAALTAATFQYRYQDGSNGVTGTEINPDIYDVNGTETAVGNNKWTIQRIYSFTSNNVKIQPGQALYGSLAAATAGVQTESFVTEPSIAQNGLLRGFLVIKKGTDDLSDPTVAVFLAADKFGGTSGSGSGASVSSLQNAYINSDVDPEITTNTIGGAVQIRRGTAADTDVVFAVQNGAGTETFSVCGDGSIISSSLSADLGEFTVAMLPDATTNANSYALATNASGGRTIVRSNGSEWRVVAVEGAEVET